MANKEATTTVSCKEDDDAVYFKHPIDVSMFCNADEVNEELPPSDQFPNDDDNEGERTIPDSIHWRDVPRNTWLRIMSYRNVTVESNRTVKIVYLLQRDGTTYSAWTTSILTRTIDEHYRNECLANETSQKKLYIKSLGKTASISHPAYSYYDFKLKLF